jgi:hypothetical protein
VFFKFFLLSSDIEAVTAVEEISHQIAQETIMLLFSQMIFAII